MNDLEQAHRTERIEECTARAILLAQRVPLGRVLLISKLAARGAPAQFWPMESEGGAWMLSIIEVAEQVDRLGVPLTVFNMAVYLIQQR